MAGAPIELDRATFAASIDDHPFAVVRFAAPSCVPSRAFAPVFADAARRRADILFARVDIEAQPELAAAFRVDCTPLVMVFRRNVIVFAQPGAIDERALDEMLALAA